MKIFLKKNLKCNDSHTNIIRIQLKKEVETFYDRTEDFHLKSAWLKWGLHMISDQIEDIFWKISHTMIVIQIELSDNWKGSVDIFW